MAYIYYATSETGKSGIIESMPLWKPVCGSVSSTAPGCLPGEGLRDEISTGDLGCVFHKHVVSTVNTGRLGEAFCTSNGGLSNRLGLGTKGLLPLLEVLGAAAVGSIAVELAPPAMTAIWLDNMWGKVCFCGNGADG